jgi:hypothetical protein
LTRHHLPDDARQRTLEDTVSAPARDPDRGRARFHLSRTAEFKQLLVNPGKQLPRDAVQDLTAIGIFLVMQTAFWCRQWYAPIPFRRSNTFVSLLFLFLGRLSFIFGGTMFSVTVFRHLPEFGRETDVALVVWRGAILIACLFALFCTSRELERLGQSFDSRSN